MEFRERLGDSRDTLMINGLPTPHNLGLEPICPPFTVIQSIAATTHSHEGEDALSVLTFPNQIAAITTAQNISSVFTRQYSMIPVVSQTGQETHTQ